jgi:hypothetical protein
MATAAPRSIVTSNTALGGDTTTPSGILRDMKN